VQKKTTYIYNSDGQLVQEVKYARNSETGEYDMSGYRNYVYEGNGRLYSDTEYKLDAKGNVTRTIQSVFLYDSSDRVSEKYYASVGTSSNSVNESFHYCYTYDPSTGVLLKEERIQEKGTDVREYKYEDGGSLPTDSYYHPASFLGTETHTVYEYDSDGNCVTEILKALYNSSQRWEDNEKTERTFDEHGNLTAEIVYYAETGSNQSTVWRSEKTYRYTYDSLGHLVKSTSKMEQYKTYVTRYVYGDAKDSQELIMPVGFG